MSDSWSLTVDIPASDLVLRKRQYVRRTLGIPALHNLRGPWSQHHVVRVHQRLLDAELLVSDRRGAADHLRRLLQLGDRFDVMLIRRAPRPLDCAVQEGDWKRGGRLLYGDNASSAMKLTRDWTAKRVFGLDGDSSPLIRWHVGQERSGKPKLYQISVLIVPAVGRWWELPDRWLKREL